LDPDALSEANELAGSINARIVSLAMKVDDAIMQNVLNKNGIKRLLAGARMVNNG
jgi:hypothetical protein